MGRLEPEQVGNRGIGENPIVSRRRKPDAAASDGRHRRAWYEDEHAECFPRQEGVPGVDGSRATGAEFPWTEKSPGLAGGKGFSET